MVYSGQHDTCYPNISTSRAGRLAGSATAASSRDRPPSADTSAVETQLVDGPDLDEIAGVFNLHYIRKCCSNFRIYIYIYIYRLCCSFYDFMKSCV